MRSTTTSPIGEWAKPGFVRIGARIPAIPRRCTGWLRPELTDSMYCGCVQDEIPFFHHRFELPVGSKSDHNTSRGFEIHPSARVLWKLASQHSLWGSATRAVGPPPRLDEDIQL